MIRSATKSDSKVLAELAIRLWNDHTVPELEEMFDDLCKDNNAICFIKYVNDIAVGFAQCQIRTDYVEGTKTSPVGYLEGIFVDENIDITDMQRNSSMSVRNGQKKRIAPNLRVIVNWIMI